MLQMFHPLSCPISLANLSWRRVSHIWLYGAILFNLNLVRWMLRSKTIENFKLPAQKVVKVAYNTCTGGGRTV